MWPAIIAGGAALLGGALDRKQRNKELKATNPKQIRAKAEAAGFNPLLFTGAAFQQPGYGPVMGSAVANAGAAFANQVNVERDQAIELTRLEMENKRLQELARRQTLRPTYGGVYSGAPRSIAAGGPARSGSGPTRPQARPGTGGLAETVAPGRDVNAMPINDTPGLFTMNNRGTAGDIAIPGDTEPWGVDELLTAAVIGGPQVAWNWMRRAAESIPGPAVPPPSAPSRGTKWGETRTGQAVRDFLDGPGETAETRGQRARDREDDDDELPSPPPGRYYDTPELRGARRF